MLYHPDLLILVYLLHKQWASQGQRLCTVHMYILMSHLELVLPTCSEGLNENLPNIANRERMALTSMYLFTVRIHYLSKSYDPVNHPTF